MKKTKIRYPWPTCVCTKTRTLSDKAAVEIHEFLAVFFKWIKQHWRIKHFLGNSENALKTQVWCAIATYVLIAIVKKELQTKSFL